MSVIRKISQWAARTGGAFLSGGVQQQAEESGYMPNQGVAEGREVTDPAARGESNPSDSAEDKYGGRQVYRCREDRERDEAKKAAQEAEAQQYQQAQYQQQYAQEQMAYQDQQYQQAQQQYAQEQAAYQAQQYQQAQYQQQYAQEQTAYQAQQQYAQEQAAYQAQQYQQQYAQEQAAYQAQQYQQAQQQYAQEQAAYQAQQYQQAQQQYAQEQTAYQNQQSQASNVVTFPGMLTGADGRVYAHVEYIIQMTHRQECWKIIEYIRANASVFLNMETINPTERQRCVDMLSGASFALGCRLNKISHGGIYLISSPSVQVMADKATQLLSAPTDAKNFARQRYEEPAQSRPERVEQQSASAAEAAVDSMPVDSRKTGFSSGSPTTRFRLQGSHSLSASYGTVAAGTYTGTFPAVNAH